MTQMFRPDQTRKDPMMQLETVFSAVLDDLFKAFETSKTLRTCVDTLAEALNKDKLAAVQGLSTRLRESAAQVQTEVDETNVFVEGVSGHSRKMGHHLKDLGENIQSANIIALNARIIAQGHRHIERGAQMVRLSENISEITDRASHQVAEMAQVMDQTTAAIEILTEGADRRSRDNAAVLVPRLAEFAALQSALEAGMKTAEETAVWLSDFVGQAGADMAQIIAALQTGDRSRQRMEHVWAIRAEAANRPVFSPEAQALTALADRQEAQTAEHVNTDVHKAADQLSHFAASIESLQSNSTTLSRTFQTGRLRDFMEADLTPVPLSIPPGARSRDAFTTLQDCDERLRELSEALSLAAFQMQLASINTIIACARVGRQAADMIVISQQINEVISAVPAIFGQFAIALDETKGLLRSSGLSSEEKEPEMLDLHVLDETKHAIASALPDVTMECNLIVSCVGRAHLTLLSYAADLDGVLKKTHSTPPADLPEGFVMTEEFKAVLDDFRSTYTMAEERDLHDDLFAGVETEGDIAFDIPAPAPEAAAGGDDLSDILF